MALETLELSFDVCDLPTAQHRAGLAGLLVLTESLRRRKMKPLPVIRTGEEGRIAVRLTQESLQVLLDDLYDASWEQRSSSKKPLGKSLRKVRTVRVKPKKKGAAQGTMYTFETIAPKVAFLKTLGMPEPWLKLWREAIWGTLRGIPMTRNPYEQRLADTPVVEASVIWGELLKRQQGIDQGQHRTVKLSSSLFLGAQAVSAERVPFQDRADHALLLHFWPVVMGIYVPEIIDRKGQTRFVGYVFAVPDVEDPESFSPSFLDSLGQLGADPAGYRPRDGALLPTAPPEWTDR